MAGTAGQSLSLFLLGGGAECDPREADRIEREYRLLREIRGLSGRLVRADQGEDRRGRAVCPAVPQRGEPRKPEEGQRPRQRDSRVSRKRTGPGAAEIGRHPDLPFCARGGRPSDADDARGARRGVAGHTAVPCTAVPGDGLEAAEICAHLPADEDGWRVQAQAVQAERPGTGARFLQADRVLRAGGERIYHDAAQLQLRGLAAREPDR